MRFTQLRFDGESLVLCASKLAIGRRRNNAASRFIRRLISKRCKSCQTLYQSRMRIILAVAFCSLFCVASISAKQRHCTIRIHAEANAHDSEVFSSKVRSQFTGKDVVIEKTPTLTELDVAAFRPYPTADGSFGALLQFDDHGQIALDSLSIERRGTFLFVFVNGRPITELRVDRRVADGKIYLPRGITAADIELMRKDWRMTGAKKK